MGNSGKFERKAGVFRAAAALRPGSPPRSGGPRARQCILSRDFTCFPALGCQGHPKSSPKRRCFSLWSWRNSFQGEPGTTIAMKNCVQ